MTNSVCPCSLMFLLRLVLLPVCCCHGFLQAAVAGIRNPQSAIANPYLFHGARYDAETGFYCFRNRMYDPRAGRFLQRDPVWDEQNVGNQYTFVGSSPLNRWDPLGLGDPPTGGGAGKAGETRCFEDYLKQLTGPALIELRKVKEKRLRQVTRKREWLEQRRNKLIWESAYDLQKLGYLNNRIAALLEEENEMTRQVTLINKGVQCVAATAEIEEQTRKVRAEARTLAEQAEKLRRSEERARMEALADELSDAWQKIQSRRQQAEENGEMANEASTVAEVEDDWSFEIYFKPWSGRTVWPQPRTDQNATEGETPSAPAFKPWSGRPIWPKPRPSGNAPK